MNMQSKWIVMMITMMAFTTAGLAQESEIDELSVQIEQDSVVFAENQQEYEAEMEQARIRLEQAAREIAELTSEMVLPQVTEFVDGMHMGQRRAS